MTLNSDAKFEEKLICCLKNDTNLVKFDPSTQESKTFALSLVPFVVDNVYKRITFYKV